MDLSVLLQRGHWLKACLMLACLAESGHALATPADPALFLELHESVLGNGTCGQSNGAVRYQSMRALERAIAQEQEGGSAGVRIGGQQHRFRYRGQADSHLGHWTWFGDGADPSDKLTVTVFPDDALVASVTVADGTIRFAAADGESYACRIADPGRYGFVRGGGQSSQRLLDLEARHLTALVLEQIPDVLQAWNDTGEYITYLGFGRPPSFLQFGVPDMEATLAVELEAVLRELAGVYGATGGVDIRFEGMRLAGAVYSYSFRQFVDGVPVREPLNLALSMQGGLGSISGTLLPDQVRREPLRKLDEQKVRRLALEHASSKLADSDEGLTVESVEGPLLEPSGWLQAREIWRVTLATNGRTYIVVVKDDNTVEMREWMDIVT